MDNDNVELIPITMRQVLKARIRNDKSGQKLAIQKRNRRRNKLARVQRRINVKTGHTAGKQ